MRGKAPINRHQAEEHGVTPACAGKSAGTGSRSGASWDHPRVCGEKADWTNSDVVEWGSPPRVRGKVSVRAAWRPYHGITPAYAGKRQGRAQFWWPTWDHPRMCGEKALKSWLMSGDVGSPPHVRGKEKGRRDGCDHQRITPAYAGKRQPSAQRMGKFWDHPRVCGEKTFAVWENVPGAGSLPRMRGKVVRFSYIDVYKGITPAYAGKSCYNIPVGLSRWDHPRACGEKYLQDPTENAILGSPPHVRGKDFRCLGKRTRSRITPACTGKSCSWPVCLPCRKDHPRVCGEKSLLGPLRAALRGSPPRMRGKGVVDVLVSEPLGITPACAGKSGRHEYCPDR